VRRSRGAFQNAVDRKGKAISHIWRHSRGSNPKISELQAPPDASPQRGLASGVWKWNQFAVQTRALLVS